MSILNNFMYCSFCKEITFLPKIPLYLIEDLKVIESRRNVNPMQKEKIYASRITNDNLTHWAQKFFDYPIVTRWQIQYNDLGVHVDNGIKGIKYNYYLNLGGKNVKTLFWNDLNNPTKIIQEKILNINTWYALQIDIPHSTFGLDNPPRLSVTIKKQI